MDKFYRYLRKQPAQEVYFHYNQDKFMLTIGTGQVVATFYEPNFKPADGWKDHPIVLEKLEEAVTNAEEAETAEVISTYKITLVVGESKAVAVKTEQLRLFNKITAYKASNASELPAAVLVFGKGVAVIAGLKMQLPDGHIVGYGYELEQVKQMIERALGTQKGAN